MVETTTFESPLFPAQTPNKDLHSEIQASSKAGEKPTETPPTLVV
jgi:hypothetical protein